MVFPLHPRTRIALNRDGLLAQVAQHVQVVKPVGFLDMLMLEQEARHVVTDSGGVQREAFFFRIPCSTLRAQTEWVELVEHGWNRLIPPVKGSALGEVMLEHIEQGVPASPVPSLYGDGEAALAVGQLIGEFVR